MVEDTGVNRETGPIKDILIAARQESHRMRHYYLGVEHLFIALLEQKGGLTTSILTERGLSSDYLIDLVRRKAGKGGKHRLWAGVPNTPRTEVILSIAQEIAAEHGRKQLEERDLLLAILDEGENVPARVLRALQMDLVSLRDEAATSNIAQAPTQPFIKLEMMPTFQGTLTNNQLFILRRMFHGYAQLRVESRLTGGYTSADLLVVTPINPDGRSDASVVVKIGNTDVILDEAQRYERFVKSTLPPLTARLEERPIAPETSDLAGLKYTLITNSSGQTRDMRSIVNEWSGGRLGKWLRQELYDGFGDQWWKQNRPYRFEVWREYDWLLPPILTLHLAQEDASKPAQLLKFPIQRQKLLTLDYGDRVTVDSFIVHRVDRERRSIRLALAQGSSTARPYQIDVIGIDFDRDTYFRGEIVDRITGTVWKTRREQLVTALKSLDPDFDIQRQRIELGDYSLPNPLQHYDELLDQMLYGSLSTIHGDLHLGNILLGPNDNALLIDFARTRDGHTLFDWANLEVSLLGEMFIWSDDDDWSQPRDILHQIAGTLDPHHTATVLPQYVDALMSIEALRTIVEERLARRHRWREYHMALAMCALRAVTWETMPVPGRRLLYLVCALAMDSFVNKDGNFQQHDSLPPDATDLASNTNE